MEVYTERHVERIHFISTIFQKKNKNQNQTHNNNKKTNPKKQPKKPNKTQPARKSSKPKQQATGMYIAGSQHLLNCTVPLFHVSTPRPNFSQASMESPYAQNTKSISNYGPPRWTSDARQQFQCRRVLRWIFKKTQSIWGSGGVPALPHHTALQHLPDTGPAGPSPEHACYSSNVTSKTQKNLLPPKVQQKRSHAACFS